MPTISLNDGLPLHPLKVWVLAPHVESNDANIDYYYDFSQSIEEYKKVFAEVGLEWHWQPVTMLTYENVIENIVAERTSELYFPVILNLCDGDEVNGTPGISVVHLLEKNGLVFTGSDAAFYDITTSKIPMKQAFDKSTVATAAWEAIKSPEQNITGIFDRLGSPLIVKPSVSGGSMGVGIKNVVYNEAELREQITKMFEGYRGWNLCTGGLIVESFIQGPEYTALIVGSYDQPAEAIVYTPVERIFHESLPEDEKFLSFDRLWEIYEEETAMPNDANFYEYALPDDTLINAIKKISWDAYVATKGKGYARADIRRDKQTGKLYVLEINAQCGISDDENFTSIGAILRVSNKTFSQLVTEILNDAFINKSSKNILKRYA